MKRSPTYGLANVLNIAICKSNDRPNLFPDYTVSFDIHLSLQRLIFVTDPEKIMFCLEEFSLLGYNNM
jgi:hypothetical protein